MAEQRSYYTVIYRNPEIAPLIENGVCLRRLRYNPDPVQWIIFDTKNSFTSDLFGINNTIFESEFIEVIRWTLDIPFEYTRYSKSHVFLDMSKISMLQMYVFWSMLRFFNENERSFPVFEALMRLQKNGEFNFRHGYLAYVTSKFFIQIKEKDGSKKFLQSVSFGNGHCEFHKTLNFYYLFKWVDYIREHKSNSTSWGDCQSESLKICGSSVAEILYKNRVEIDPEIQDIKDPFTFFNYLCDKTGELSCKLTLSNDTQDSMLPPSNKQDLNSMSLQPTIGIQMQF